ncbi:8925_t:CDS:2, partial [Scutellospora calospora]
MSNENIFNDLEFNNLELYFNSNDSLEFCFDNNDNRDFFDEILDNNGQLIINNEEDDSLSDCEVNDLTDEKEAINRVCTKFLTPAVLKLQYYQMNQYVHYHAHQTNLKVELQQKENICETNILNSMFSKDLYDEMLIELAKLLHNTSHSNVKELWIVSLIEQNERFDSKYAISIQNWQRFSIFKHEVRVDFSYIDSISLNLVIETGYAEELYRFHQQFIEEMRNQLAEKGTQKKVIKKTTNVQHNQRSSSSNMSTRPRARVMSRAKAMSRASSMPRASVVPRASTAPRANTTSYA